MEGIININGLIGSIELRTGVELVDVVEQVKAQPLATSFRVNINSEGGVVDTGFHIYDYLKSLKVPITTVGNGLVASIATVIFMAGDNRILNDGTRWMIHLPAGEMKGTADQMEAFAKEIRVAEKRLIDFYKETTGISEEGIKPLLANETWLTNEQAVNLGFATIKPQPVLAVAYFTNKINYDVDFVNKMIPHHEMAISMAEEFKDKVKSNVLKNIIKNIIYSQDKEIKEMNSLKDNINTNIKKENMTNEDKSWLEKLFAPILSKGKEITNITVTDADGKTIDFGELVEGDEPKAGDKATIDGVPAEGDVLMPDGSTFVFVAGELMEIKVADEASPKDSEETMALKAENESLKQQLATAKASFTALETSVVNLKKQITSRFDVDSKKEPKKEVEKEDVENRASGIMNRIKRKK